MENGKRKIENSAGTLFVVATPIGNLEDITLRALEILKAVDLIACEDTRHTGMLLKHYGIEKPLVSYFQHSKISKAELIIEKLLNGQDIALVTDAGTPGISDPGQALIQRIREAKRYKQEAKGIKTIPIPGPSALTAAASVSGMIEKEFYFAGFLLKKKGRQTEFKKLSEMHVPIVIYESANRLERTLGEIKEYFGGDAEVFVAREISKIFEEYWGGKVSQVIEGLSKHQLKGEIVLMVKK